MQDYIIYILLAAIATLIIYVIYLLHSARARAEKIIFEDTKNLNASLERFEKLYEEAPVPYIILDESGQMHKPNKAALRFFGVIKEEIEGKSIFLFQPEEDKDQIEKLTRYYGAGIAIDREEVRMITKSGAVRWALLSVFEIKSLGKHARTGLASIFDITEQKKLDQAKTEFVSLASHQLRTPVATVKWFSEMLLSGDIGELSTKQKDYLERVYKVNQDMVDLVDTLLNVSRIEIGSLKVETKSTDVSDLVENILVELSAQIEEKKLNIIKQYGNNPNNIESDPKLLRIVIQNLLTNSVKYTPPGGSITVTLQDSPEGREVVVSDTGYGIPKEEQDKIFTKLFRAGNIRNMEISQGTGLGLYLVKSIIEALGGGISFVSEENKGSVFTIKL